MCDAAIRSPSRMPGLLSLVIPCSLIYFLKRPLFLTLPCILFAHPVLPSEVSHHFIINRNASCLINTKSHIYILLKMYTEMCFSILHISHTFTFRIIFKLFILYMFYLHCFECIALLNCFIKFHNI